MFVKLTSVDNTGAEEGYLYVSPQHIVCVKEYSTGNWLGLSNGSSHHVRESAEEVYKLIDKSVEEIVVGAMGRSQEILRMIDADELDS